MADIHCAKYRLYPQKEQEKKMLHFLDCTRTAYNRLVEICKLYVEKKLPFPSEIDLIKMAGKLRQRNPWMQDVHSHCFKTVGKRVHSAFVAWFKRKDNETGFPRFKSSKMFDSFTYTCKTDYSFVGKNGEKGGNQRIRLGMIGLLKYGNPFVIKGECKTAIVFRKKIGTHFEWFISIAYENKGYGKDTEFIDPIVKRSDVGLDLGLDNLVTLSDGTIIPNDHTYKKKQKELAKIQMKLSEYEKDSADYNNQWSKLAHIYKKLGNHRNDMFHKISRELCESHKNIYMEDLSIKTMIKNAPKGMKKSFRDAGWRLFTKMMIYKVEETGNSIIFVNPAYTSQLCSSCGTIVSKDLSVREHVCPHCGLIMSRDKNAAINLFHRRAGA